MPWKYIDSDGNPTIGTGEFGGRQPGEQAWFDEDDPRLIAARWQEQQSDTVTYKPWAVVAAEYLQLPTRDSIWINLIGDWAMDPINRAQSTINRTDGVITSIQGIVDGPESRAFWAREMQTVYESSDAAKDALQAVVRNLGYTDFTVTE